MVNWKDPATVAKSAAIFANVVHLTAGAYALDVLFTSVYDWEIVTGKRGWKWTMPLYFFCKWIMFFSCIAMLLVLNIDVPINCQALYSFAQFAGNSAIGSASTLLMLRTIAIWNRNLWVTIPLVLLSLGQWGILFHGMTTVRSIFMPEMKTCVLLGTGESNNLYLNLLYLYTMFVDLVVLILSVIGLLLTPGRSSLWKLLFKDGIVFFVMAFLSNTCAAVVLLIDLNPAMNLMFSVPAACITASAAARSFIRLSTWAQADVYVHQTTSANGGRGPARMSPAGTAAATGNVSMVTWARTKNDLETGTIAPTSPGGYPRIPIDMDEYDYKNNVTTNTRTVGFTRATPPSGVMITMDTFSQSNSDNIGGPKRSKSASSTTSSLEFDSSTPRNLNALSDATHSYGDGKPSAAARF